MDNPERNFNVQLRLSKEIQESFKAIEETAKFRAQSIMAQQMQEVRLASANSLRNAALEVSRAIQAVNRVNNLNVSEIAQRHEALFQEMLDHQRSIAKSLDVSHLRIGTSFAENIARVQPALSVLQSLKKINLQDFEEVSVDESELDGSKLIEADETFFQKLYLFFKNTISELPKGRISANGISNLYQAVVSTILLLYTISQSQVNKQLSSEISELKETQQTTNKLLENITGLGEDLYPLMKDLAETENQEIIFLSKKESPIKSSPTSEADTLARIPSGQEVEVIENLNRWYHIKYYDYKDSALKKGYIYKGNISNNQ